MSRHVAGGRSARAAAAVPLRAPRWSTGRCPGGPGGRGCREASGRRASEPPGCRPRRAEGAGFAGRLRRYERAARAAFELAFAADRSRPWPFGRSPLGVIGRHALRGGGAEGGRTAGPSARTRPSAPCAKRRLRAGRHGVRCAEPARRRRPPGRHERAFGPTGTEPTARRRPRPTPSRAAHAVVLELPAGSSAAFAKGRRTAEPGPPPRPGRRGAPGSLPGTRAGSAGAATPSSRRRGRDRAAAPAASTGASAASRRQADGARLRPDPVPFGGAPRGRPDPPAAATASRRAAAGERSPTACPARRPDSGRSARRPPRRPPSPPSALSKRLGPRPRGNRCESSSRATRSARLGSGRRPPRRAPRRVRAPAGPRGTAAPPGAAPRPLPPCGSPLPKPATRPPRTGRTGHGAGECGPTGR